MMNALRIGVCDDEIAVHTIMERFIHIYSEKRNIPVEIVFYESGIELLDSQEHCNLDALFLDIDMPELDGIETVYRLNEKSKVGRIIMLTSKSERFKEAFEIGAFRFVTKPIEQQEVFKVLDAVRGRMLGNKEYVLFRNGRNYSIYQKDIVYVMINKKSSYVYTNKYEFRSAEPLSWWEENLDKRMFFRCHKGYIINMEKIVAIENGYIRLFDDEKIPIARRRQKELEQCYMEYDTKYR